ncbi:DUF4910 domain-containing protein [Marinilabiliaceae bacterium ANBcel2]|nr:DUF4910 domain-containing protein [Marinilabiliaceae bacterium ANBcel2]
MESGDKMYLWAKELFPITRSITGEGVRKTLKYIKDNILDGLHIHSVPTGYKAFDWEVPKEWSITEAYIENETGEKIVDFKNNNLHVLGYSTPVDKWVMLDELKNHLYSLPQQPDAIPYVTSYYKERWGFCLSDNQMKSLKPGKYHAVIKSNLKAGVLNYGELILPGESDKEVFLSTYICHPSMANNELSGPVVTSALAEWLMTLTNRYYTYRIVFIPETIGSIVYISKHLEHLKNNVVAGFNITCIGDDRCYSFLPSRRGDTIADKAALHALKYIDPQFKKYTWLQRGSDERQYCSPGVDLPVTTIMRSKYGTYPQYHTSLDNLDFISPYGLQGGYDAVKQAIKIVDTNCYPMVTTYCEPQMGKRGLYSTISQKGSGGDTRLMMNFISYCDGTKTVLEIAEMLDAPYNQLFDIFTLLLSKNIVKLKR